MSPPRLSRRAALRAVALGSVGSLLGVRARGASESPLIGRPAPEFTERSGAAWLNSAPLLLSSLRGRVVLLDVWTFGCWNCYRSFPWLKGVERRLAKQRLAVVGIHAPEFDHERSREKLEQKIREFGLTHPIMMDNDHAYWRALQNRYWPAFYLIDKRGTVRDVFIGETHADTKKARALERAIALLLAEKPMS